MYEPSSQPQRPAQPCRSFLQDVVIQELRLGRDTIAGIAHRHGLPLNTILNCWEQYLDQGIQAGPFGSANPEGLLEPGITPEQSRFSGLC
jgi:hypothetical protein